MQASYDLSDNFASPTNINSPEEDKTISRNSSRDSRPRLPEEMPHEILLAIGGWSGGSPTNEIEAYDSITTSWRKVTEDITMKEERPRAYHGVVFWDKYIYIIGGFDGQNYYDSVRRINIINFNKSEEPPMNSKRCYVSCCISGKTIWAIGGMDGNKRLDSCECYTIGQSGQSWKNMPNMNEKRSDADSTAHDGKIYVVGGFNGTDCLNSVEFFDNDTFQWTKITPMNSKRSGPSAVCLNDKIFAVGGFDDLNRLRSAEYYCSKTNTWHYTKNMINPRSNFGIEVLDNRIIAIGGFNGYQTTSNVEAYDDENDEWYELPDMKVFRSALACVTIKNVPMDSIKTFAAEKVELLDEDSGIEEKDMAHGFGHVEGFWARYGRG